jgi:hypothetical protein
MDKLKPASLTSSLLATKGAATPAMPGTSREALARLLPFVGRPRLVTSQDEHAPRSKGKRADGRGRGKATVNVSFRLETDRHLRLKLLAAHRHGSLRDCLEEAVERYLASSGPDVRGGGCACIVDRGDPET